jgi:hypothetical protein
MRRGQGGAHQSTFGDGDEEWRLLELGVGAEEGVRELKREEELVR